MKVILSKKGLDSGCSNWPIFLKKGETTMPFIPISEINGIYQYSNLGEDTDKLKLYKKKEAVSINQNTKCHLDPQLKNYFGEEFHDGFRASFGQSGRAQGHLNNCEVGVGDIFLFFGWYYNGNTGKYENIIWGYMEIGYILTFDENKQVYKTKQLNKDRNNYKHIGCFENNKFSRKEDVPQNIEDKFQFLNNQPHWIRLRNGKTKFNNDVIYIASECCMFNDKIPGFGIFNYDNQLVLTAPDTNCKTEWYIEDFEKLNKLYPKCRNVYLNKGRGRLIKGYCQELVFKNKKVKEWAKNLIESTQKVGAE